MRAVCAVSADHMFSAGCVRLKAEKLVTGGQKRKEISFNETSEG